MQNLIIDFSLIMSHAAIPIATSAEIYSKPSNYDLHRTRIRLSCKCQRAFTLPSLLALSHQLANNQVLAEESLLPALQALHLLVPEPLERVKRAVEVLGQHVLVEAVAREATARIATSKVLVWTARPVEVAAAGDVEDAAPHGHVDGHVVRAVVGQQRARGEGAEDDGGRLARKRRWRRGLVEEVRRVQGYGDKNQVQRCRESGAAVMVNEPGSAWKVFESEREMTN